MRSALLFVTFFTQLLTLGCGDSVAVIEFPSADEPAPVDNEVRVKAPNRPGLGAFIDSNGHATFRVFSARATQIELSLYVQPLGSDEVASFVMTKEGEFFTVSLTASQLRALGITSAPIFYGYRAWGPNWPYVASWKKGALEGYISDVDSAGNRFNPNKLLTDPYALEVSHDNVNLAFTDGTVYASGPAHRQKDSGRAAPKSILLPNDGTDFGSKPTRPFKDEIIYEVHLRGFTMNDSSVPEEERGTYAGAARKADYLASIGVTAIELLPLHESPNEQNDLVQTTNGANYWGYASTSFFAPERRYAADRSPGGPTRELKTMIRAFHARGIKVYVDVVYNHTGEGYLWANDLSTANITSFRGLDNATYYELTADRGYYFDNTGTGGNFNTANPPVRTLIIDSLKYWKDSLGVDGFRFDLASVLGNRCTEDCFVFDKLDPANVLNRAVRELPVRGENGGIGVDLIAEPWAASGNGNYQVGGFPSGWAEWNGIYRDTLRDAQNRLGVTVTTPAQLARRLAGSSDLYQDDGRRPWHSVNFIVSHDGFTLRDLYVYNGKNNLQPWPFAPSDGGEEHNRSWNQGGDVTAQRQASRTGMALLMLSAGVPMITGGDEMYRTQYGNNNAYNLDSIKNWLDWNELKTFARFYDFSRRVMKFRQAHPALRPAQFFEGRDHDGNGLKDITWLTDAGLEANGAYMDASDRHFLAYRLDGEEASDSVRSIYVAYNGWHATVTATLPQPAQRKAWFRAGDTAAWDETNGNFREVGDEERMAGSTYDLAGRSVLVLIER